MGTGKNELGNGAPERRAGARIIAALLWVALASVFIIWAMLVWHPWIDWFGDPRR